MNERDCHLLPVSLHEEVALKSRLAACLGMTSEDGGREENMKGGWAGGLVLRTLSR